MSPPIDVLVTAVGGFSHGGQVLKALLAAEPGRYRVHGADAGSVSPQFASVASAHRLPLARDPSYLDALLSLCRRLGARVVIHGSEPELRFLSQHRDEFRAEGILLPINPARVIEMCMDKARTNEFLLAAGFPAPSYKSLTKAEEIDAIEDYPVVVKPSVGGGGSADVFIAQTRDELAAIYQFIASTSAAPIIAQEYVGRPEDEYTIGVLHDLDGAFVNSIAVKRVLNSSLNIRLAVANRTDRTDLGPKLVISSGISHGHVGQYQNVSGPCEAMAAALGAAGPVNIQARLVNGMVKVFEINPRFSGTTSLRAIMGFNEPDLLIRKHLLGETIEPRFPYREGLVLRSLLETEITAVHTAGTPRQRHETWH